MTSVVTVTFTAKYISILNCPHFIPSSKSSLPLHQLRRKSLKLSVVIDGSSYLSPTSNSTPLLLSGYKNLTVQSNIISSGAGDYDNVVY